MVDLADPFDAAQPYTIEIHLNTELLDIIRVSPPTVGFEELATALLALVALPASTVPVFRGLNGLTLRTFHESILLNLALHFQQRRAKKCH